MDCLQTTQPATFRKALEAGRASQAIANKSPVNFRSASREHCSLKNPQLLPCSLGLIFLLASVTNLVLVLLSTEHALPHFPLTEAFPPDTGKILALTSFHLCSDIFSPESPSCIQLTTQSTNTVFQLYPRHWRYSNEKKKAGKYFCLYIA